MAHGPSVSFLDEHMENYTVENSALRRKLASKVEALKILRRDTEKYRTERDQFKLMAETLQLRYTAMKKSLNSVSMDENGLLDAFSTTRLMNELREKNINLMTEVEKLRQTLLEKEGDIRVLREERRKHQQQMLVCNVSQDKDGGHGSTVGFERERSEYIAKLETLKKRNVQLQFDFRSLLDEKEELVTERDAYKCKSHRLNHELSVALGGNADQSKILDIDALVLENKFLQDKLQCVEGDVELGQQSIAKYKKMLETKQVTGNIKIGSKSNASLIMSSKQVRQLMESGTNSEIPIVEETIKDLKSLCLTLLDNVNDKTLALRHQKKANKILANRLEGLEAKLQHTTACDAKSLSDILLTGYRSSLVDEVEQTPSAPHHRTGNTTESTSTTPISSSTVSISTANEDADSNDTNHMPMAEQELTGNSTAVVDNTDEC